MKPILRQKCTNFVKIERATGPVLISVKEEEHIILHNTLNIAVRRGKLWTYTLQNTPKVFSKFAPSGGYKEIKFKNRVLKTHGRITNRLNLVNKAQINSEIRQRGM